MCDRDTERKHVHLGRVNVSLSHVLFLLSYLVAVIVSLFLLWWGFHI